MIFFRRFLRRHVVDDAPIVGLPRLDNLDGVGRRPAVRPVPESIEEALSDDDLFAVARGAGVVRESLPESTAMALLFYEVTGDADAAMRIFRGAA